MLDRLLTSILTLSLRGATPLTMGALCGIFCERSGVVNIAIEGIMLASAFHGYIGLALTGSFAVGLLMGILTGILLGLLHGVLSIRFRTDQIISGTVINILALGYTGYFRNIFELYLQSQGILFQGAFRGQIVIPLLSDIPIVGPALFRGSPITLSLILIACIVHIILFFTRWGLRTRAVGEHPRAADTLGINVFWMRYANVVIGGMLAGIGGAWFTIESVGKFQAGMTAGRGFIALACMIFGKWTPFGALGAALL
ncbi:MAG: ABC transporter permease, partial [Deinococcus sp.]|nr:ABC transporter permease [Deinococcus sp.]